MHGSGPATVVLLPAWSIVRSRMWKAQVPAPGPAPPRGHLRRARQRRVGTPGRGGGVRQRRVRRRHGRGHGCRRRRPGGARGPVERCRVGRPGGRRAPRAGAGPGRDRAGVRVVAAPRPGRAHDLHRPAGRQPGVGEVQPPPLARGRLRRLRRVLLRPDVPRAALDPPARGGQRLGARGRPADPGRLHLRAARPRRGARPPSWGPVLDAVQCPVLVLHGSEDRVRALDDGVRFADRSGGSLVVLDGAGHGPPMRDPVVVNRELDRFVERVAGATRHPGGRRRGAGRGRCAGSARCSCSRRRSAWATPGATWRSSRRCAPSTPTCGCGGWRRTRSPGCWSRPARRCTRRRGGWRRSRRTSRPSAASTTSTRSRRSGGWTTSWSTTSWCSTRCSRPSTSTSSSATRRGRPTTSCTRTRS